MSRYTAMGFRRFMYRLMEEGLTWLGYYFGSYRAEVVDRIGFSELGAIASGDLDKIALLKVRIPAIGDTPETPPRVAYPKTPLAGDGYGFKSLPPKGSYIWVEFEHGKPDMPIWTGGWWAKGEMPSDLESLDAHGWITPTGHKILLIDDVGQETLRIEHKLGGYLEWDNQGNVVLNNYEIPGSPEGTTTISSGEGATEAAILGDTLVGLLGEILDAINQMTMLSPAGTTSVPVNAAAFAAIKARLETALSVTNKVK